MLIKSIYVHKIKQNIKFKYFDMIWFSNIQGKIMFSFNKVAIALRKLIIIIRVQKVQLIDKLTHYVCISIIYTTFYYFYCVYSLPNMVRFGAHTSKVTFIQVLITQWYWKRWSPLLLIVWKQLLSMESHFILLAAFFHDDKSDGHRVTTLNVMADSLQAVKADTFW